MTTIITKEQSEEIKKSVGTLMFPSMYYDTTHYIDTKKTKARLGLKGRIKKVYVTTNEHPDFENKANTDIIYNTPLCASREQDGAYLYKDPDPSHQFWVSDNPVGKVYVVM
tara:strand:- start:981 stop:1313 length:333 start_codon:yes stop_codon:yes gene_type:complete